MRQTMRNCSARSGTTPPGRPSATARPGGTGQGKRSSPGPRRGKGVRFDAVGCDARRDRRVDPAGDVTIKHLTRRNPTMAAKFDELAVVEWGRLPPAAQRACDPRHRSLRVSTRLPGRFPRSAPAGVVPFPTSRRRWLPAGPSDDRADDLVRTEGDASCVLRTAERCEHGRRKGVGAPPPSEEHQRLLE